MQIALILTIVYACVQNQNALLKIFAKICIFFQQTKRFGIFLSKYHTISKITICGVAAGWCCYLFL